MASLSLPARGLCRQCLFSTSRTIVRSYATDSPAPPLLLKLRQDLKTAMQSKDANRLSVLRGLLSDITNASKLNESSAPKTDVQILSLLRKRVADSKKAAHQFGEAGRIDLKEKEDNQVKVMDEYAEGVETVDDEEIRTRVGEVVTNLTMAVTEGKRVSKGDVMKKLLGPGGIFDGKPVEKSNVAKLVDMALGEPTKS